MGNATTIDQTVEIERDADGKIPVWLGLGYGSEEEYDRATFADPLAAFSGWGRPKLRWEWVSGFRDSDLASTTKLILFILSSHMKADGTRCFPSLNTIGREASLTPRAAQYHLKAAEAQGWIIRHRRFKDRARKVPASTIYEPTIPEEADGG